MIAKLEWTSSSVQQNIEQLHTRTMRVTLNNCQFFCITILYLLHSWCLERNSSYSFMWIFFKLHMCFIISVKMCVCLDKNRIINKKEVSNFDLVVLKLVGFGSFLALSFLSRNMRFPTIWYVRSLVRDFASLLNI